jgi:hypothetical protein
VPKPRHDNPHAERLIVELDLPAWISQRTRAREAGDAARRERELAALRAYPWAEMTPAELAFVWCWQRDPQRYAQWCAEARSAFQRKNRGGHTE